MKVIDRRQFLQMGIAAGAGAVAVSALGPAIVAGANRNAGTPDPDDRQADGTLDLMGSITRELAEETGLEREEYEIGEGWVLVRDGGLFAFLRPVQLREPAAEARAHMLRRMRGFTEQELSDIYVAREPADVDEGRMPPFVQTFLRWAFA